MATATKDTSYTFAGSVATALLLLGTQSCLAWLLGPDGRGEYAACVVLVTLLTVALGLGVEMAVVYYIGAKRLPVSDALAAGLVWSAISSVAAMAVGLIVTTLDIEFVQKAPIDALRLSLLLIPLNLAALVLTRVLIGLGELVLLSITTVGRAALTLVVTFVSVQVLGFGLFGALAALLVADAFQTAVIYVFLRRRHELKRVWPSREALRLVLGYGWRFYFGKLGRQLNLQLGTVLLACIPSASKADLGLFAAAVAIMARTWMIVETLNIVLLPRTTRDQSGRAELVSKCARLSMWASFAALLPVMIFAKPLVVLVLSPEFADVVPLMWILAGGVLIRCFPKVLASYFIGVERPGLNSVAILAGLATNALMMVVLFPPLGLEGAALAVTIGYFVESLVAMASYTRLSGERFGRLFRISRADVGELRSILKRFRSRRSQPKPT